MGEIVDAGDADEHVVAIVAQGLHQPDVPGRVDVDNGGPEAVHQRAAVQRRGRLAGVRLAPLLGLAPRSVAGGTAVTSGLPHLRPRGAAGWEATGGGRRRRRRAGSDLAKLSSVEVRIEWISVSGQGAAGGVNVDRYDLVDAWTMAYC